MLKKFIHISLSCLFVVCLISCKKDADSGANTGGTSFYTLEGAPSGCTGPVIAGIYSVGIALTSANTATLSVNVTSQGTYSMRTTSSNGVYFSGSGTFTSIGPQKVVLTGQGTPVRAGIFSFVPSTNNTCNFDVSFTAGGPSAVFTYAGAPGNCTAPIIGGTYSSGISLGSGNYADLAVNVTAAGAYTIITNNANGISFSGSGVFTAPGPQVVRLIGNGTPATTGVFTYKPSNNGCNFSITVTPPLPPATFTYNGAPGGCTAPAINGTYAAGTALNASNTIVLGVNVTVPGSYSVSTNSSNGVVFSASGNFAATGANTITLTSTSTPGAAGTFSYTPSGGCSFDITYTGGGGGGGGDFIKCTIDGVVTNFAINTFGANDNTSAPYLIELSADLTSGGDNFAISVTDENNPVVTGVDYGNRNLLAGPTKYCEITYSTGPGFPWGSSITNNSFTVRFTTLTATSATGTFSGKVYDNLGTGTIFKTITNGTFSITF